MCSLFTTARNNRFDLAMIQLYEFSTPIHGPGCISLLCNTFTLPKYDIESKRIVGLKVSAQGKCAKIFLNMN
jgi:hypothetical protein